jgi:hypothetical protein
VRLTKDTTLISKQNNENADFRCETGSQEQLVRDNISWMLALAHSLMGERARAEDVGVCVLHSRLNLKINFERSGLTEFRNHSGVKREVDKLEAGQFVQCREAYELQAACAETFFCAVIGDVAASAAYVQLQ